VLNRGCTISEDNQHLLPPRDHLYLGVGRAQLSRKGMFRATSGLAVTMEQRVFQVPPVNGGPTLDDHSGGMSPGLAACALGGAEAPWAVVCA
jgi:hypothetical protein